MSDPIDVGDLVQVVQSRACCTKYADGAELFVVVAVKQRHITLWCCYCDSLLPNEPFAAGAVFEWGMPLSWLRKIPPLADLESTETKKEITA